MSEDCEVREKKIMVRVAKKALSEGWVGRFLTTNLYCSLYCRYPPFSVRSSSFFKIFYTHTHQSCCDIDGLDTRKIFEMY